MKIPQDFLNEKAKRFKPYSLNNDIKNFRIRLDANESFINLPEFIVREIKDAVANIDYNRYPDFLASDLIKKYSEIICADEKHIVAGNGSDELINIIINSFLSKGDKILTFTPDFSMYAFYSEIIEAQVVRIEKKSDEDFSIDFDKVAEIIKTQEIKAVIFSNPCNPTGKLTDKAILEKFVRDVDALVIIDEVYMTFCDDSENQSFIWDFIDYPNLIILKSLSKAFGLASIRTGFAISNEIFINLLRTVKSPFNLNAVSQKIAETVLFHIDYMNENIKLIKENKSELEHELRRISNLCGYKLHETQTNFVLLETERAGEIFEYLLSNGILIRQLNDRFLRISTGSKDENAELLFFLRKKEKKE
jgi:histidinol-phosphate aminotransferase